MQQVIYNGGTQSYYEIADPSELVPDQVYEVVAENYRDLQTNYILDGYRGEFNSDWFDEVPTTYFAISSKKPIEGEPLLCIKLLIYGGSVRTQEWIVSGIELVEPIGKETYRVMTDKEIYIIMVK